MSEIPEIEDTKAWLTEVSELADDCEESIVEIDRTNQEALQRLSDEQKNESDKQTAAERELFFGIFCEFAERLEGAIEEQNPQFETDGPDDDWEGTDSVPIPTDKEYSGMCSLADRIRGKTGVADLGLLDDVEEIVGGETGDGFTPLEEKPRKDELN